MDTYEIRILTGDVVTVTADSLTEDAGTLSFHAGEALVARFNAGYWSIFAKVPLSPDQAVRMLPATGEVAAAAKLAADNAAASGATRDVWQAG